MIRGIKGKELSARWDKAPLKVLLLSSIVYLVKNRLNLLDLGFKVAGMSIPILVKEASPAPGTNR
jgi:hypothetical protein